MLELLRQHAPKLGYCIAPQMHMVSAHPELHIIVRDSTPLEGVRHFRWKMPNTILRFIVLPVDP
jgi:hypothetical protein